MNEKEYSNRTVDNLLILAAENAASDVVAKTGYPGFLRINGTLHSIDTHPLSGEVLLQFVESNLPSNLQEQWEMEGQVDFSHYIESVGRFRVNAFLQRGMVSIVFRHIKSQIPTYKELNLDGEVLTKLVQSKDGIILVCGATGSGKSSTLASMLGWVNRHEFKHVVTLEDPIEYNFIDGKSVFSQREIGIDTPSYEHGMKAVLRQNPDIILIGEMRDRTSFETALSAAETGHLVLSTLHANSCLQAVTRLFEFYPVERHLQIRRQLATTLRGIIVQTLIPAMEGGGRVPAQEILVADSVARNLIADGKFEKLPGLLDVGADTGSQSMNKDLFRLIKAGVISKADGLRVSPNAQALEMNLKGIFMTDAKRILG